MDTSRFETAFRIAVSDWESGKLSAEQAMEVMSALREEWDLLQHLQRLPHDEAAVASTNVPRL